MEEPSAPRYPFDMNADGSPTSPQTPVSELLFAARKAEKFDPARAEELYYEALGSAERRYGRSHAAVGLVLIAIVDFYCATGKMCEATVLRERISAIAQGYEHRGSP